MKNNSKDNWYRCSDMNCGLREYTAGVTGKWHER